MIDLNETSHHIRSSIGYPPPQAGMGGGMFKAALWHARRGWIACVQVVLALGATALWAESLARVDPSSMTDLGLVSVLPPSAYAALLLLTISFCLAVHRRQTPWPVLLLHVVLLIVIIHGTPSLLYGTLRYSWAWKHVGIVDYIQRHGSVDPGIKFLDAYHNWPGFFALSALAVQIAGLGSALGIATWAPPLFNLLFLGALLLVMKAFTDDRRLLWLGIWFFFATNWVGQDYFSPQAFSYFLHLVIVGVCLRWFGEAGLSPVAAVSRWGVAGPVVSLLHRLVRGPLRDPMPTTAPERPAERVAMLAITVTLFGVVVASHQLTPFMTTLAVTALVLSRRCNARWLPILMAVLLVTWIIYAASTFVDGHLRWILETILRPFDNFNSNLIDLSRASAGQRVVAVVDRGLTAAVGALALLGFVRRLRQGFMDLAAVLLMLAPFPMLAANSYGGEMVFRIYFFALPFAAFFAAALLYPTPASGTSWRTAAIAVALSAVLLASLDVAYYGKDRMYYFTQNEVAAARYLNEVAAPGALFIEGTWDWPAKYKNYEYYDYRSMNNLTEPERALLDQDPVDFLARLMQLSPHPEVYVIITRSQKAEVDMTGVMPAGSLARIEDALRQSELFSAVFTNADATIFTFGRAPVIGGP